MGRVDVQHAYLGGQDQAVVVGDVVPGGPQAVAVQHRPHLVAVGEQDGGWTVPGLHHHGVILVQVPPGAGQVFVVHPGLGNADHHRQGQLHAAHHQEFQGVVQHGGVRAVLIHHGEHFVNVLVPDGGVHGLLPGQHPAHVAPDGVDLPVVEDKPVGVGPLPRRVGVGGEPGVHQGDGRSVRLALQIRVELPQLAHQEHPLIHDGPAGQGRHIGVVVGLLELPAGDVQPPVKFQALRQLVRAADKALHDPGHFRQRLVAQHRPAHGHLSPADELHALPGHDKLKHFHGLVPSQRLLREEKHADAIVPLTAQGDAALRRRLHKKLVGDLQQDTHAVAGPALGVLASPVLQLFHDLQRVVHRLMGLSALDVHNGPDAAVVVLKPGIVQRPPRLLPLLLHS